MKFHKSITLKRLERVVRASMAGTEYAGFCIACGHKQHGVEPDAEAYRCESCGESKVYGAEDLALAIM